MQSPAERLAALPKADQQAFITSLTDQEATALLTNWRGFIARPDQLEPDGEWDIWLALAGRGWGKTETGARWVQERVEKGAQSIALVGETQKDLEEVMVGRLLKINPNIDVRYKPVRVRWPNGAVALGYNGTQPDQLRGPEFDTAWVDELAKYKYARETWDMLQFGMRIGQHPRQLVTTTPRPIELIKAIVAGKEGRVSITRGRTYDNAANLADTFLRKIELRYANTRLGRQELDGEILGDIPGALWTQDGLDRHRLKEAPELGRIVVGVDPAVTSGEDADETGLIVCGRGQNADKHPTGYVLEDGSIHGTPDAWARRAVALYRKYDADAIVAEVNNGGEMVAQTIKAVDPNVRVIEVRATRGKHVRAEPISALYEQGRVHHVGSFPDLENQLTMFTSAGYEGEKSPDRADALVWALSELMPSMVRKSEPRERRTIVRPTAGGWMG